MPGAVLGAGNTSVNKAKIPALAGKTENDKLSIINKGKETKTVRK